MTSKKTVQGVRPGVYCAARGLEIESSHRSHKKPRRSDRSDLCSANGGSHSSFACSEMSDHRAVEKKRESGRMSISVANFESVYE